MKTLFTLILVFITGITFAQKSDSLTTVFVSSKAVKTPQEIYKNVIVIDKEELAQSQGITLEQLLHQQTGIQMNGAYVNSAEPKTLSVRGSRNKSVVLLIDGIPQKDVSATDYTLFDMRNLDISQYQQIEILNNASSVLYGANASVSVINLITKKSNQTSASIAMSYGSFGTVAQQVTVVLKANDFTISANGSNEISDGFSAAKELNSDDDFDKDGYEKQTVNAQISYQKNKFKSSIGVDYSNYNYEFDNSAFTDNNAEGNNVTKGIFLNNSFNTGKHSINLTAKTSNYKRKSNRDFGNPIDDIFDGNFTNIDLYDQWKAMKNLNILAGINYEKQSMDYSGLVFDEFFNSTFQPIFSNDVMNFETKSAYAEARYSLNKFNLNAGARYAKHSDYDDAFIYSISPSYIFNLGANQKLKTSLTYATAYITPTLYQLYGNGSNFVLGNTDLKPEENKSATLDVSFNTQKVTLFGSLFYREEEEVFVYNLNRYENLNDNIARGFEAGFDWKINSKIQWNASFSFAENEYEQVQFRLPTQKINSALNLDLFTGNHIQIQYQYTDEKDDGYFDNNTFTTQFVTNDAYSLFHLFVQQKLGTNFTVFGSVKNILDEDYTDIVGYTSVKRNYNVGAKFSF